MKLELSEEMIKELDPPAPPTFLSAALEVYEQCPASAVFSAKTRRPTHGGMWYGIFVHRFLEYVTTKGAGFARAYIQGKGLNSKGSANAAMRCCLKIDTDALPDGEAEVAMVQHMRTGEVRRLFQRFERAHEMEQYGKMDFLFSEGRVPHVVDWKCGMGEADPRSSTQVMGLACALRTETDEPMVKASLVGVGSAGDMTWYTAKLHKSELDAFEARMKRTHLRVMKDRAEWKHNRVTPEFEPGPQCHRCANQMVCPAVPPALR